MALRRAAWAIALFLAASSAQALPVLRLALAGDPATLGAGAAQPFQSLRADALRLERPALLDDFERGFAWVQMDAEDTVEIDGSAFYAGTRAGDVRARTTVVRPFQLWGEKLTVAVSGRLEDGSLRVRNRNEGVLVNITEHRVAPQIALAARPFRWLRLGAATGLGVGLGRSYALEAIASVGSWELGFVRRDEELDFNAAAPRGPQRQFTRPALVYDIAQTRRLALLDLRWTNRWGWLFAAWDALHPQDAQFEGALTPWPFLTVRGRWESVRYAFDDWAKNDGAEVAKVDLGVRVERWVAGVDVAWRAHRFLVRRMSGELSTASSWQDNGVVTGQRILDIPQDFSLYLRHIYNAKLTQYSAGWTWSGTSWSLSAGLQHLRADSDTGGLVYGSEITTLLSGRDVMPASNASALVFTGGLGYRRGALTLRLSAAQIVPYASGSSTPAKKPSGGSTTPTTPTTPKPPPPPVTEQIAQATQTYGGGRLVLLELSREF